MVRPLKDRESNKFDNEDRVKVSIEQDNTVDGNNPKPVIVKNTSSDSIPVTITNPDSGSDVDVTVKNTSSDAIPVEIVNTDTQVDLEVNIVESITIDSSTPVDVNLTNSSVNTNATIVGTPNVNVSNSELTTRNQLEYTAADITALGSSTNVTTWTSALADGVLTKEFVDSYQNEFEQITLYTHPDLGDNDKALKKITQYSTQNGATVIESVDYDVITWDKDASIQGTVSVTASNISPADPNSTIAMHTRVADLTIVDNTLGDVTISLSGTNASLYHIHNTTDGVFGSSLTYIAGKTYEVHTASDFSGANYSHSITVTVTGIEFNITDSVNISLSGTYVATPTYSNLYGIDVPLGSTSNSGRIHFENISLTLQDNFSYSFWLKQGSTGYNQWYNSLYIGTSDRVSGTYTFYGNGIFLNFRDAYYNWVYIDGAYFRFSKTNDTDWHHYVVTWSNSGVTTTVDGTKLLANCTIYIDGAAVTGANAGGSGTAGNETAIANEFSAGNAYPGRYNPPYELDELAIWDGTTLTAQQVQDLYQTGTSDAGKPNDITSITGMPSPVRYYRFEDNTDLVYDEISSATQGSLAGTPSTIAQHTLTATDSIYVVAPGQWLDNEHVTGTPTSSDDSKRGLYNIVQPTNNKGWFPTYDQNYLFHTQTDYTISFWYQGATNVNYMLPWYQLYATANNVAYDYISIWLGNGYVYFLTSRTSSGTYRFWTVANMTSWTHVAITASQNTSTSASVHSSKLYINGTEVTGGSNYGSAQTIGTTSIYRSGIAGVAPAYNYTDAQWGTYGGTDTVKMDEITTWKKALTASEVTSLYNSGTPNNPEDHSASADLERYMRCGDASGDGASLYDELDNTFVLTGYNNTDYTTAH